MLTPLLFFGCGDPDYQKEWLGSWRDTDSGLKMTFHDDGTWSAIAVIDGVTLSSDQAGSYTVVQDTYTLTMKEHLKFGIPRQEDSGIWERDGDLLELHSRSRGFVTLRRLDDD